MIRPANRPARQRHRPRAPSRLASIGPLFWNAALQWQQDNVLRLSAAVSFYAVLSLAPLLAIVIRVMALAHARQFARQQIITQATNLMGRQAAAAIKPILESAATVSHGYLATLISSLVLLFSSTGVFIELQNSLNTIWGVEIKAPHKQRARHAVLAFIRARLFSLLMVFILGFLLVLSMFLSGLFTAFQDHIAGANRWPIRLGHAALAGFAEFALFSAIFRFLPAVKLKWQNVCPGALLAAILFSTGRFALSIYFEYSRADNLYGAAGSLLAVLTWIYYSSFSLFFGAEFAKVWTQRRPR